MRITIVEPDGFGGLAHYAYEMANALADAGADVTLITAREYELAHLPHRCRLETSLALWRNVSRDPDWAARLPYAVRLIRRHLLRVPRAVRLLVVWTTLTRQLVRERPDIVQVSEIRFPFLAHFLRRMRRAGLTLTQVCHEFEPRERRWVGRALARRRSRRLYETFSAIVFLGERVREAFLASFPVDPARTHVVAPGPLTFLTVADAGPADLRAHYDLAPEAPVALFFGGLRPSKGIDDLLPAFAGVLAELPDACLVVAGTPLRGVRPEQYVTQAHALGIGHAVRFDPAYVPVERVGALMRTAAVVVLPYRSGTASGVIQAAYAFGRPVVVTRVGAIAEAVDAGKTGLVVEPGDSAALAAAMVTLMRDPARAESMGAAARRLVSGRHAWPAIAETMLDVLRMAQTDTRAGDQQ